jgi:uncharacterized phage-associated protein
MQNRLGPQPNQSIPNPKALEMATMKATVFDVAKYILLRTGPISSMRLQKLVYYSQAWSLVWDDSPLFDSQIEAWANGPVCRELYEKHRGAFLVSIDNFSTDNIDRLSDGQKDTIDKVLEAYGNKSAQWLSDQTHSEAPWLEARSGLGERDRGSQVITFDSMSSHYGSLI